MLTPTASVEFQAHDITVWFAWDRHGVDRNGPGYGILVRTMRQAERLIRANDAGVLWTDAQVKTDVRGKTYISATCKVYGRHLEADLKALGY